MPHRNPPGGIAPTVLAHDVETLQVAELYRNLPLGAGSALLGTILCVFVLAEEGLHARHVVWLGYGIIVAMLRLGLCWAYRDGRMAVDSRDWGRLAVFGNLLAGIQWGLLGTWLFPVEPGHLQNFAIMVITCYVGGSVTAYAPLRWAHPALSVPAAVPPTVHIFFIDSGPHPVSGFMAFFFVGMVLFYALRETEAVAQRLRADTRIRQKLRDLEANARLIREYPVPGPGVRRY